MMKNPPHPGDILLYDIMEPLGLSFEDTAAKLGVSQEHLIEVVEGRSGISPDMAKRLSDTFDTSAKLWENLQAYYDTSQG